MSAVTFFALASGGSGTVETLPDPAKVSPGFAGFSVIFLLALATIVLIRSMTRHLRQVRFSPDPADQDSSEPGPLNGHRPAALNGHRQGPGHIIDNERVNPGGE